MQENEILAKLTEYPGYLKKGNAFLAEKFNTTTETILKIKSKLKQSNTLPDLSSWEIKQVWQSPKGNSILYTPKQNRLDIEDFTRAFKDFLETFQVKTPEPIVYREDVKDLTHVVCLMDTHLGRQSFKDYTNDENNLATQLSEFSKIVTEILKDIPLHRVKEIILPIGNDFFNVDNIYLQTTKGTPQNNTSDLYSTFKIGLDLIANLIVELSFIAPVKVIHVPGNHDRMTSSFFALSIQKIFENSKVVTVDARPIERKYYKIGNTLLGLAHGELKPEEYAKLLPFEGKEYFSSCKFYEYLLGDKHHEKYYQRELDGVVVRHLSGLTRKDVWTYHEGYTTSIRRGYSILYHETEGRYLERVHQMN